MFKILKKLSIRKDKSFRKELKRKAVHLSSLWIPVAIYILPQSISLLLFSILFAGDFLLEYGNYKKWGFARFLFGKFITPTLRNKEINKKNFVLSGSIYVLGSAIACSSLFSREIAVVALVIMLVSDTCAAIFGKLYGMRKVRKEKSTEGTFAFFLSALIVMIILNPVHQITYASIIACIIATLAELYEDKLQIDDNLSICLSVGSILTLLG